MESYFDGFLVFFLCVNDRKIVDCERWHSVQIGLINDCVLGESVIKFYLVVLVGIE